MSNFVVWQRCLIVMQFAHPLIAIVKLYEQLLNYWAIVKLCTPLHNRHPVFVKFICGIVSIICPGFICKCENSYSLITPVVQFSISAIA